MAEENRTYDWDDVVQCDEREMPESVILPDGNYAFEVISVEKAFFDGSKKLPACNMAKVYLRLDGEELGKGFAAENLFLCDNQMWKAASFLRSIGLKKKGDPVDPRLILKSPGEKGRCKVYVDEFEGKDGNTVRSNKVKSYFDKEEEQAPKKTFEKGKF